MGVVTGRVAEQMAVVIHAAAAAMESFARKGHVLRALAKVNNAAWMNVETSAVLAMMAVRVSILSVLTIPVAL